MKTRLIAIAVLAAAGVAQAQPWALPAGSTPSKAVYDPAAGPLPLDRRYMMTREGAEAARYEAMHPQPVAQAQPAPAPAPAKDYYNMPKPQPRAQVQAPAWFVNLPADTVDMVFSAGTATSSDEQMAYDKARMQAERKLVEIMGSQIRTLTKSYRNDQGDAMIERFEQTIQKTADGNLVGVQRVDSQATFDGRQYKVYVLVRYPLGENNILRKERETAQAQRAAELRAARAHQELDNKVQAERKEQAQKEEQQTRELAPLPEPAKPATVPQSQVTPVTVPTAQGEIKLMDVNNEEYKRRRDETLQKAGAVIGQTEVR